MPPSAIDKFTASYNKNIILFHTFEYQWLAGWRADQWESASTWQLFQLTLQTVSCKTDKNKTTTSSKYKALMWYMTNGECMCLNSNYKDYNMHDSLNT